MTNDLRLSPVPPQPPRAMPARSLARLLGAFCTASLLSVGCGNDNESAAVPTDNSGVTDGMALVKFCHELKRDGKKTDLTLEFGTPVLARVTATTGSCSPPVGVPCASVPAGSSPGRLMEGDKVLSTGGFRLGNGTEYLIWAEVNSRGVAVPVIEGVFQPGQCTAYSAYPDGGASDGGSEAGVAADAADSAGPVDAGADVNVDGRVDAADAAVD